MSVSVEKPVRINSAQTNLPAIGNIAFKIPSVNVESLTIWLRFQDDNMGRNSLWTAVMGFTCRKVSLLSTSLSQRVLPMPSPRPFKVSTNDRCKKKGVIATSLDDLLDKTASAFLLSFQFLTLVLESDGTTVDTEEFFQSLPANTPFIVLERGQRWTKAPDDQDCKKPRKNGMAKLSFHLYKLHPKDFLGCLIIKARLCEMYTLSYDIRCVGVKQILMAFLRCLAYMVSLTGHLLQFGSSYVLQYIGEDEYQSSNTQQPFCLDSAS